MATVSQLETVLRYAYLHSFKAEQWIEPTKECLESNNLETDLCSLLINSIFSFTRVSDPLLESYLTLATTGNLTTSTPFKPEKAIFQPTTLYSQLVPLGESTATKNPYQWSYFVKLLSTILYTDDLEKDVEILSDVFQLLSHLVAVGLYSEWYTRSTSPIATPATLTSAISFHNNNTQLDSQFSFQSQQSMQFDGDATLDIDNTQQIEEDEPMISSSPPTKELNAPAVTHKVDEKTSSSIELENAILAAQIMIHLIEKRDAKRIFTVARVQDPWSQCQAKLEPKNEAIKSSVSSTASQNPHIQKLLVLIQRLTDKDLERRLAVHMKYHELEDEGTARAMPSAGLMGIMYHMVQIRPTLDDNDIIDHLLKLQTIKGSFDESFYLELWLTALTGLREASLNTSCQTLPATTQESKGCSALVATNRLLWKSLVLVKLPCLIHKLKLKKQQDDDDDNALEASLRELKAFTGLMNACSPPACCSEFYAPDSLSSTLVDRIAFGIENEEEDDDDIMKMINDMSYTTDLNTPLVTKSIRSISNNDIFTNIVYVCERYGFVRPGVAQELLKKTENDMDIDKVSPTVAIDQNIDMRFEALRNNITFPALTELIHIGLVSPIHLRKIIDFILEMLRTKSISNDFYSLSKICDALSECPCFVDLILQLYTPSELLGPLENVCNHWSPSDINEVETEDTDELEGVQLLYYKFGKILNFVVSVVKRFKLYRDLSKFFTDKTGYIYEYFIRGTIIFGIDIDDASMEPTINNWMTALAGGDGLSDDLLLTTRPQTLVLIVPTIIQRGILLYSSQQMDKDVFFGMLSYFQNRFLNFTLSSICLLLCEELLGAHPEIALECLCQLIMSDTPLPRDFNLHPVLGSLESMIQYREQQESTALVAGMNDLKVYISKMTKLTEDHTSVHVETVTTDVTPSTLFEKASLMFKYIVKSGRSMFMSDVDADTHSLWDAETSKTQVVSHYLDMVLFETALEIGGAHWFVDMIVEQVLEAGKSGGAVRAAELGSCLISTPLLYSANRHNSCVHLLRVLLQDIVPSRLHVCAEQNMSFFQGQTLGVFVSDCLVLMQGRYENVDNLGKWFFEALVIDGEQKRNQELDQAQIEEGTRFADWGQDVVKSAVWRGFIKGLMSNPMIEEVWPNAFV